MISLNLFYCNSFAIELAIHFLNDELKRTKQAKDINDRAQLSRENKNRLSNIYQSKISFCENAIKICENAKDFANKVSEIFAGDEFQDKITELRNQDMKSVDKNNRQIQLLTAKATAQICASYALIDLFGNSTSAANYVVAPVLKSSCILNTLRSSVPWAPCTLLPEASFRRGLMLVAAAAFVVAVGVLCLNFGVIVGAGIIIPELAAAQLVAGAAFCLSVEGVGKMKDYSKNNYDSVKDHGSSSNQYANAINSFKMK
jgi:hypothetical protein